jgi:diguanylate cyclase (GGDEF)-like protein
MIDTKFFEAMLDGVAYCKLVPNQSEKWAEYQYVNQAFEALFRLKRNELIGGSVSEVTPEIAAVLWEEDALTSGTWPPTQTIKQEHYFPHVKRWCVVYAYVPENDYLVIVFNDTTEWHKQQTDLTRQNLALHKRNERLQKKLAQPYLAMNKITTAKLGGFLEKTELREEIRSLLCEASNEGLWYWNIFDDQLLLIGSWYRHLNLADFKPITKMQQWSERIYPADLPEVQRVFTNYLHGAVEQCRCQYRIETGAGEYQWVEVTGKALFNSEGKPYVMAGAHAEIVQNQPQQELLDHLDYFDSLTGLPNRLVFMDCLCNAVKIARRHHTKSVVIFLDLDRYKIINESQGYEFGDQLLTMVAKRLLKLTRSYENVARWGEDEFAIILQGIHEIEEVIGFCERVRVAFTDPFELKKRKVKLSINISVAIYPEDGLEPEDLLFNAETAMGSIKIFEKDNWQFYKPVLRQEDITRKNEICKRIRKALDQKRFSLQYQPQVEMKTGKIRAVEALLRWNEPGLGWIQPLEFIPFMEKSGLIVPLGEWVLKEACRQNMLWQKHLGIRIIVAVNISAIQLKQARFVAMVKDILAATGMEPELLELEITESVLVHSFESVTSMLGELRLMGVRISLDDFGTGYSWLSYLKRLPLDTLKLDKSIINDIHYDIRGKNITEAIVDLVRKLGLTTVAEGVEHQKQLDCLHHSNCDYVQGYLLGRPLLAEEVLKVLRQNLSELAKSVTATVT